MPVNFIASHLYRLKAFFIDSNTYVSYLLDSSESWSIQNSSLERYHRLLNNYSRKFDDKTPL